MILASSANQAAETTTAIVGQNPQIETWNTDNIVQYTGWLGIALLTGAIIGKGAQLVGWFGR